MKAEETRKKPVQKKIGYDNISRKAENGTDTQSIWNNIPVGADSKRSWTLEEEEELIKNVESNIFRYHTEAFADHAIRHNRTFVAVNTKYHRIKKRKEQEEEKRKELLRQKKEERQRKKEMEEVPATPEKPSWWKRILHFFCRNNLFICLIFSIFVLTN